MDLAADSYQNVNQITSKLTQYAESLAQFQGANWGGDNVAASAIKKKVLLLVFEKGAASPDQLRTLTRFVQSARTQFPGIVVKPLFRN